MMYNVFMATKWHVLYYKIIDGKSPVADFIDSRKERNQAKILSLLSFLEEKGPNLPRPYSDLLEDGIHELRIKLSGDQIRILYFFCFKNFIILTNVFTKISNRIPKSEINKSKKYRKDFFNRFNEKYLRRLINENI